MHRCLTAPSLSKSMPARNSQVRAEGAAGHSGEDSDGRTDRHIWLFRAGISLEVALTFLQVKPMSLNLFRQAKVSGEQQTNVALFS